jgi:hypothetical protein
MILIIGCTSKPSYALNGFRVYISETIPTAKWFKLEMWGTKNNNLGAQVIWGCVRNLGGAREIWGVHEIQSHITWY